MAHYCASCIKIMVQSCAPCVDPRLIDVHQASIIWLNAVHQVSIWLTAVHQASIIAQCCASCINIIMSLCCASKAQRCASGIITAQYGSMLCRHQSVARCCASCRHHNNYYMAQTCASCSNMAQCSIITHIVLCPLPFLLLCLRLTLGSYKQSSKKEGIEKPIKCNLITRYF